MPVGLRFIQRLSVDRIRDTTQRAIREGFRRRCGNQAAQRDDGGAGTEQRIDDRTTVGGQVVLLHVGSRVTDPGLNRNRTEINGAVDDDAFAARRWHLERRRQRCGPGDQRLSSRGRALRNAGVRDEKRAARADRQRSRRICAEREAAIHIMHPTVRRERKALIGLLRIAQTRGAGRRSRIAGRSAAACGQYQRSSMLPEWRG